MSLLCIGRNLRRADSMAKTTMREVAMGEYRWNVADYAAGYDAAAEYIHPHYLEVQQMVLDLLPLDADAEFLLVDAGGGSGRLAERFLMRFRSAHALVL